MNFFIYIIKAGLQTLSERTEGQIKTSIHTSYTIGNNDKIIGYCEKPIAEYRYLFKGESIENNKITMDKVLQVLTGVKSNTLLSDVEKKINEAIESSDDLVEITQEQYETIKNKILEQLNITLENIKTKAQSEQPSDIFSDYKQIIFYGVPGCGKSYCIDSKLKELGITNKEEQTKRVVFHPEYTNSDFIGQILPKIEGDNKVKYEFIPGPFTEILKKAYEDKSHPYALIIEEINRGNAAAIFGELFQLLDRFEKDENETVSEYTYGTGWSSYCVNNDNINEYIRKDYKEENAFIPLSLFEKYKLNIGIRLPPNLSLFATMNTSDQNVFKLDNAFKRRWDLELIPNEFEFTCDDEKEQEKQFHQCNATIDGFDFSWGAFRNAINELIISPDNEEDFSSFSDKQIGTWFVKPNENGVIPTKVFANKVIEYLWDDVFTDNPGLVFSENYKSLAQIIKDIDSDNSDKIFNTTFLNLIANEQTKLSELQKNTYTKTKEEFTNALPTEYQEYLEQAKEMVKTIDSAYELSNHVHYFGVIKDGKDYGANFVHFKIKPRLNEFRFLFTFEQSDTIEQELKDKFNGNVKFEIKSKNLMYCIIPIALNDHMQQFNTYKAELLKYMQKAYDDYFKYN